MRLIKGKSFYKRGWYNSYRSMMYRCYNTKASNYKYYGGRGIRVCDEWHDIERFEEWERDHPFFIGATLDRINSNGNYEPENCRWVTMFDQDKNRRNSIIVYFNGKELNITELALETGINRSTLNNRYCRGDRGERLIRSVLK